MSIMFYPCNSKTGKSHNFEGQGHRQVLLTILAIRLSGEHCTSKSTLHATV